MEKGRGGACAGTASGATAAICRAACGRAWRKGGVLDGEGTKEVVLIVKCIRGGSAEELGADAVSWLRVGYSDRQNVGGGVAAVASSEMEEPHVLVKFPLGLDPGKDGRRGLKLAENLAKDDKHEPDLEGGIVATDPGGRERGHSPDDREVNAICWWEAETEDGGVWGNVGIVMPVMVGLGEYEAGPMVKGVAEIILGGRDAGGAYNEVSLVAEFFTPTSRGRF